MLGVIFFLQTSFGFLISLFDGILYINQKVELFLELKFDISPVIIFIKVMGV